MNVSLPMWLRNRLTRPPVIVGSRLAEETEVRPKPMVEIGGRPILWHIMKHYSHYGFDDFTIALGYKGEYIKRYFTDYAHLEKNLTISLSQGRVEWLDSDHGHENWTVRLIDTGFATMTGGRVARAAASETRVPCSRACSASSAARAFASARFTSS